MQFSPKRYSGSKIWDLWKTQFSPKLLFLQQYVMNKIFFNYKFTRFFEALTFLQNWAFTQYPGSKIRVFEKHTLTSKRLILHKLFKYTILLNYNFTTIFEILTFFLELTFHAISVFKHSRFLKNPSQLLKGQFYTLYE